MWNCCWCCSRNDFDSENISDAGKVCQLKNNDDFYKQAVLNLIPDQDESAKNFIKTLTVDSIKAEDIVSPERLAEILRNITSFECGKVQLVPLEEFSNIV